MAIRFGGFQASAFKFQKDLCPGLFTLSVATLKGNEFFFTILHYPCDNQAAVFASHLNITIDAIIPKKSVWLKLTRKQANTTLDFAF